MMCGDDINIIQVLLELSAPAGQAEWRPGWPGGGLLPGELG